MRYIDLPATSWRSRFNKALTFLVYEVWLKMTLVANRRSVMTLFSDPSSPDSHRVRLVLAEKDIKADVIDIDPNQLPEDLVDLNPYNDLPTLVDRDLALYHAPIIMEYLDERFPHPPLMPVDPVTRAHCRLAIYRVERDWYGLLASLASKPSEGQAHARKVFLESLIASDEVFARKPFFLSDDLTLVDCTVAPMLWRLPTFGIELPATAVAIARYCERVFARAGFQRALSKIERAYRLT